MSIGEFRAIVKIDDYGFAGGFHNGERYIHTEMKLEGFLVDFTFGKPPEKWLPQGREIEVSLNIKFTQQQEEIDYRHWCAKQDKNDKYIGTIRAKPGGRWASVEITLPYDMFFQIWSLRERDIIFDTIHDLITEPNEDSVVALISRVYFRERRWGYKQHSPTKRWWKQAGLYPWGIIWILVFLLISYIWGETVGWILVVALVTFGVLFFIGVYIWASIDAWNKKRLKEKPSKHNIYLDRYDQHGNLKSRWQK